MNRPYIGNFRSLCDHKPSILDVFEVKFEIWHKNILMLSRAEGHKTTNLQVN